MNFKNYKENEYKHNLAFQSSLINFFLVPYSMLSGCKTIIVGLRPAYLIQQVVFL